MTPGLWFCKGDQPTVHHRPMDIVRCEEECDNDTYPKDLLDCDEDHNHHDWGQHVAWYDHFIEKLTRPNDLIVDPTCGAGTALVSAATLGRRAVGIDIDADAVEKTEGRLAEIDNAGVVEPSTTVP